MGVKSQLEIASLIAGLILVALTVKQFLPGGERSASMSSAALNTLSTPINYLADPGVQRKLAANPYLKTPYKDYSSWIGADPRYRGGL
jgi:hypothetical protein